MKKAVIVGGSSGIGLALSKILISHGYYAEICSRSRPESGILPKDKYNHNYCDLTDFNEDLFIKMAQDRDVEVLVVTAGIGRTAEFYAHHISEIDRIITVDMLAPIKIFRVFFERINSDSSFYSMIMSSISGRISSPAASVYAAAKAGIVRFVESVNIELEMAGRNNRILDTSPGCFSGTRFYGGENDLTLTASFAEEILHKLFERETLFIPDYEKTYKHVIERYNNDAHEYGLYSFTYKKNSGRLDNGKKVKIGYLSGTFDLFHVGHLNILRRAKSECDYLIVGVHESGKWKGKETFIPFDERKRIVGACRYVDRVVDSCLEDSDAWQLYRFDILFVGSDYKNSERFKRYEEFFAEKNVNIVYLPYTEGTSSTMIRENILKRSKDIGIEL